MEEVWKEINLASLKEISYSSSSSSSSFYSSTTATANSNTFFHQFLSPSLNPLCNNTSASAAVTVTVTANGASSHSHSHTTTLPNSSASLLMPCLRRNKRPFPESQRPTSPDSRRKRMIKNRESAARSRARKQEIYTLLLSSSFEIQICFNFRKKPYFHSDFTHSTLDDADAAAAGTQHRMKTQNTLYRTTTAPF
ncbi:protein FD-like [Senna tora]|uniref:Protein FD-like n=1 Tax=Senna tora TaxID=362788 RepID=A0A834SVR7_9FABA|nr:protein FD-like [Senna tora]